MVQTMGKGLYSMSTVVQGEKLGQFLDTDMPSMDDLKVYFVDVCLNLSIHGWYNVSQTTKFNIHGTIWKQKCFDCG